MIQHPIHPVYNKNSKILILGSFPSVKSREQMFFYGHKQNRFWKVIAAVCEAAVPESIPEKKEFLLSHGIAVWDVIASCEIEGSSDASISQVEANDLSEILQTAEIQQIYCNGTKAYELYQEYIYPGTKREAIRLPSTSPANAGYSLERLTGEWSEKIKAFLYSMATIAGLFARAGLENKEGNNELLYQRFTFIPRSRHTI